MSWSIPGWKRQIDSFHLVLGYGEVQTNAVSGVIPGGLTLPGSPPSSPIGSLAGATEGLPLLLRNGQPIMASDKNVPVQVAAAAAAGAAAVPTPSNSVATGSSRPGNDTLGAGQLVVPVPDVTTYGDDHMALAECKYHIQVDWMVGEDEEVVALRLQSQIMAVLPPPGDQVQVIFEVANEGRANVTASWRLDDVATATALGLGYDSYIQRLPSLQGWADVPSLEDRDDGNVVLTRAMLDSPDKQLSPVSPEKAPPEATFRGNGEGEVELAFPVRSEGEYQLLSGETTSDETSPFGEAGDSQVEATKGEDSDKRAVKVHMRVHKLEEPLRVVSLSRKEGGGVPQEKVGMLSKILDPGLYTHHWRSLVVLDLSGCLLLSVPPEMTQLVMLEQLFLDSNRLTSLPPDVGRLVSLRILRADHNLLATVPVELRQCTQLVELSLEHNKLVRPLLDFSAMNKLRALFLSGNPLEFFPEILPCVNLRHLTLANVRIESDHALSSVEVTIETETPSYFAASKHKLSTFFALIFRYPAVQHPLLASALARIAEDVENRSVIGKDDQAIRQILSMLLSDKNHVVEQGCLALSSLAADPELVARLLKADVVNSIQSVMRVETHEILVSVVRLVANIAFSSDAVAIRVLTRPLLKRIVELCLHRNSQVQTQALLAVGNLAFCAENRNALLAIEGFRDELFALATQKQSIPHGASAILKPDPSVEIRRAALRALAIFGENEYVCKALQGRAVAKRGVRILAMDGGGMRGMATVKMLRRLEQGVGRPIHEMFDLICGTSTGGMLAVAIGLKRMKLDQCEEIYKNLGKLVFAEPVTKDEQAATWRDKLDQMYKSGTQNLRIVVHGSKHQSENFERLLMEMCADPEGNLLIESAVKGGPKVFVVSTLVSVTPAQPFLFRNYQYPPGTPQLPHMYGDGTTGPSPVSPVVGVPGVGLVGTGAGAGAGSVPGRPQRLTFMGSCKHQVWEAIRASSAAPYYLDDFFSGEGRWQDGAVVANNPALMGLREARLLWPDQPVDCLLSLGCGNVPCKPRGKGNWRFLDSGQVLIESACTVERAEETLDTLAPLIPDLKYWRFNPIDDRCGMELDETDPAVWAKLEAAAEEYINSNDSTFEEACRHLATSSDDTLGHDSSEPTTSQGKGADATLGWRRKVLLVEGRRSPDVEKPYHHAIFLKSFWVRHNIKWEHYDLSTTMHDMGYTGTGTGIGTGTGTGGSTWDVGTAMTPTVHRPGTSGTSRSSPRIGPGFSPRPMLITSPASAIVHSPTERGLVSPRMGPPLGVDGAFSSPDPIGSSGASRHFQKTSWETAWDHALMGSGAGPNIGRERRRSSGLAEQTILHNAATTGAGLVSPPWSPVPLPRIAHQLPPPASDLLDRLVVSSTDIGVVHLALHSDRDGLILCWQSDVISVAEPGEIATAFVAEAIASIWEVAAEGHAIASATTTTTSSSASASRRHETHHQRSSRVLPDILPADCTLSDLVAHYPRFTIGGALHRFIGRHTQVLPNGREVGAFLFRRTLPADRLSVDDIRWMAGAWRERLVVCSGPSHGDSGLWVDAFLEAGAKGVVAVQAHDREGHASSPSRTRGGLTHHARVKSGTSDGSVAAAAEAVTAGNEHFVIADEMDKVEEEDDAAAAAAEGQTLQTEEEDEDESNEDGTVDSDSEGSATGKETERIRFKGKEWEGETSSDWPNTEQKGGMGEVDAGGSRRRGRKRNNRGRFRGKEHNLRSQEEREAERGTFWSVFYEELFRHGKDARGALKKARELHPSVGPYQCYTKS